MLMSSKTKPKDYLNMTTEFEKKQKLNSNLSENYFKVTKLAHYLRT